MARNCSSVIGILVLWCSMVTARVEYMKYKDPKLSVKVRVRDLMRRMTLEEKIGQMSQIERSVASAKVVNKYHIGSVLTGVRSLVDKQSPPETYIDTVNELQKGALSTRLGIPIIYGIDAVHGNNAVYRATIFPHNIGLGATRDPVLIKKIGAATALEIRATGIQYSLAPCIAVCRDPRWGRCFESFSEDTQVVRAMTEIIPGLQGDIPAGSQNGVPFMSGKFPVTTMENLFGTMKTCVDYLERPPQRPEAQFVALGYLMKTKTKVIMLMLLDNLICRDKVLACAKHFVGDGGTTLGIDRNNTVSNWEDLLTIHMLAYNDSIIKGVSTVMISYSSWNGIKMHANRGLITGYLKDTLRFQGFVVSDSQGIDKITSPEHANYTHSILTSVNAGIDMIMIPYNYTEFIDGLTYLVENNFISISRINDAVKRILGVKFMMGIFEDPISDYSMTKHLGSQENRELAREAVRKSLVLLKNSEKSDGKPLLPLPKRAARLLVAGSHADDIGNQCGGWTIKWQGFSGNTTVGTTVLTAIKNTIDPQTEVIFKENPNTAFIESNDFSYAIVVVGEFPYSETYGDSMNLTIPEPGIRMIRNVCGSMKCVVVLITGRPVVIEPYLDRIDALVAAWLPGTEGQGVADVLFGDYGFSGKLPRTWFKNVDQLPMNAGDQHYDPLFPFGFGLSTEPIEAYSSS